MTAPKAPKPTRADVARVIGPLLVAIQARRGNGKKAAA